MRPENFDTIARAIKALEKLAEKLQKPRCRIKTARSVRKAAGDILEQTATTRWIDYTVERFGNRRFWKSVPGVVVAGVTSLLLIVYSAIVLSTLGFNPFIYFRF